MRFPTFPSLTAVKLEPEDSTGQLTVSRSDMYCFWVQALKSPGASFPLLFPASAILEAHVPESFLFRWGKVACHTSNFM